MTTRHNEERNVRQNVKYQNTHKQTSSLFSFPWRISICHIFFEGTPVAYNYNSDQGIVIGGNYDSTTGILTIMDDFGYNPRGEVELGTKTVIGALAGPISAGVAVDLFYQG